MAEQKKELTPIQKLNATAMTVQSQVQNLCKEGKLNLPTNYSAGNALKQFQLKVQDDEKLMSCSQASLAKAMLDMCVLGLNISKTQCYCIPYGNKAQLSISYLGKVAIAKRIDPTIDDIFGRVVKAGEDFDFEDTPDGYSVITKHKRTLASMNSKEIIGAYATIVYKDGKPNKSLIMTFDRIKKSWAMSTAKPIDDKGNIRANSAHDKFTDDMAIKTVVAAICKPIISTSSDADLFGATVQSIELNEKSYQSDLEAKEKMCSGDIVDVDFEPVEQPEHSHAEPEKTEEVKEFETMFDIDKNTGEVLLDS